MIATRKTIAANRGTTVSAGAGERSAARIPAPMTVKQIARHARVTPDVVRYYTRIGLLQPHRHPRNGYKLFGASDVRRLRFARRARALGYTLGEIRGILRAAQLGRSPCPVVREIMHRRIVENGARVRDLLALQTRMERALKQWERVPDRLPDGDSICHLIESVR